MTPDASKRATTKDILRHEWLAHGPVLSLRLNSTTPPITPSSLLLTDQQTQKDYENIRLRTPTTFNDKSVSPTNSLLELELHTSSFFDTAKLRDNHSSINREQQRRNRASAIPDATRYYASNNSKSNPSSYSNNRRPLSLSLDEQSSPNPNDYHFASTSENLRKHHRHHYCQSNHTVVVLDEQFLQHRQKQHQHMAIMIECILL